MAVAASTGRRERRKQEVRSRITAAAIELLSTKPLEQVTVEDIIEGADIAKKTFYNHYPSKQDLIETISQTLLISESRKNYELALEKHASTQKRLEFFLTQLGRNLASSEILERNLIMHAMLDLSVDKGRSRAKLESNISIYEQFFIEGRKIGDVNDKYSPRFLAEMVAGAINTSAIHWIHYPDYPLNKRFKELKDFIIDIVIKPETASKS